MRFNLPARIPARRSIRLAQAALLVVSLVLLALHFLHLTADFPANTPWMDWAKYTDEGWYGDAAIRLITLGHWRVPGDFNPAAALPVWPVLEAVLFRLTGVSLAAARALSVSIFVLIACVAATLVRDALRRIARASQPAVPPAFRSALQPPFQPGPLPDLFGLLTLLLLASSAFCFAFSRMAILEPLLILLGLAALRLAIRLGQAPSERPRALLLGLLLVLMVLTKTTALFLAPSILLALWAATGWHLRRALPPAALALATALGLWLAYFLLLIRPHLLTDYRYLFSANAYTAFTRATALSILRDTFRDISWIGLAPALAALVVLPLVVTLPRLRRDPLAPALLLWLAGYLVFLTYHANLQPRYFLVLAAPLLALPPLALGALALSQPALSNQADPAAVLPRNRPPDRPRFHSVAQLAAALGTVTLVAIAIAQASLSLGFVRHPTYQFLAAARGVASIINSDPRHRRLLLSISGSDISLMTGIPSICDDFGTSELEDRTDFYHPGWYAAWNRIDDDKMDALTPQFHLERVASFPAYDDPERNLLILYRLDTPGELRARRSHHLRRPIPRRLETRTGQQPSPDQLQH